VSLRRSNAAFLQRSNAGPFISYSNATHAVRLGHQSKGLAEVNMAMVLLWPCHRHGLL
jgi:hypothetical protein